MVAAVTTTFRAITGQFNSNVRKATNTLNKYGKAAEITSGKTTALNNSMRGASTSANLLSGAIGGIGLGRGVGIAAVAAAVARLSGSLISAAASFEDIQIRFNTFTGSGIQTAAIFDRITDTALRTGTQLTVLRETQSRLQFLVAQGTTTQTQLNEILDRYANLAALSGTSTLDLALSMRGFAQAAASPIIQMQEIRQIAEAIPSLFAGLSKALDLSGGSLRDFVAEGRLTQPLFLRIIPQALKFAANSAEANSDRISASWRNVENQLTLVTEQIGFRFRDAFIASNEALGQFVVDVGSAANTVIDVFVNAWTAIINGGQIIANFFNNTFGPTIELLKPAFDFVTDQFARTVRDIKSITNFLDDVGAFDLFKEPDNDRRIFGERIENLKELIRLEIQLRSLGSQRAADEIGAAASKAGRDGAKTAEEQNKAFSELITLARETVDARLQANNDIIKLEQSKNDALKKFAENNTEVFIKEYAKTLRGLTTTIKAGISEQKKALTTNLADQRRAASEILKIKRDQIGDELSLETKIGELQRSRLSGRRQQAAVELALSSAITRGILASFEVRKAQSEEERKLARERVDAFTEQAEAIAGELTSTNAQIRALQDIASIRKRTSEGEIQSINEEQKKRKEKELTLKETIQLLKDDLKVAQESLKVFTAKQPNLEIKTNLDLIISQLQAAIQLKDDLLSGGTGGFRAPPERLEAFATGGPVPGSGRGDRVRALLEPREFVLRRSAALSLGPGVLNTLNRGGMRGLQRLIAKGVGSKSGNIHVPTLPAGVIQGRQSGGFINPTGNEQRVILDVRLPNGRGESIPTTKDGGEAIARLFAEFANL